MPTPLQILNKRRQKRELSSVRDRLDQRSEQPTNSEGTTPKESSSIRNSLGVSESPTLRNDVSFPGNIIMYRLLMEFGHLLYFRKGVLQVVYISLI